MKTNQRRKRRMLGLEKHNKYMYISSAFQLFVCKKSSAEQLKAELKLIWGHANNT